MTPRLLGGGRSLLGVEIRRSFTMGRVYLLVAFAYTFVFQTIVVLLGRAGFETTVPLLLPIFGVVGALGALAVYSSDRIKGVYEYLMAYGFSPQRLFYDVLIAAATMVSVVDGASLAYGVGFYVGTGGTVSSTFVALLLVYTLPMSYASVAFATVTGVYWTSISSPRAGLNSPLGFVPLVGIAPALLALIALQVVPASPLTVLGGAVLLVALVVGILLRSMGRFLPKERLLSPA